MVRAYGGCRLESQFGLFWRGGSYTLAIRPAIRSLYALLYGCRIVAALYCTRIVELYGCRIVAALYCTRIVELYGLFVLYAVLYAV